MLHFLIMPALLIEASLEVQPSSFGEEISRYLYASSSDALKSSLNTLIRLNEFGGGLSWREKGGTNEGT